MKSQNLLLLIIGTAMLFCNFSCTKYLDAKPDKRLILPNNVEYLQGLLDNNSTMNWKGTALGEVASDNYYLTDIIFNSLPYDRDRKAYLWQHGMFDGQPVNSTDWAAEYNVVYNANVVLDALKSIKRTQDNASAWGNCKGSALVFRAKSFYEIAQVWTKAYDSSTAKTDLGIPLRLTSDFNIPSVRASLQDTYNQIIEDLKDAIPLLPNLPTNPMRPSKAAAYGLLARTYLTMGDYLQAELYADSCLKIDNNLIDYNNLDSTASYPIRRFSIEDIMHSWCLGDYDLYQSIANVDTSLYQSYSPNDLRRVILFYKKSDGTIGYKGSYEGRNVIYNGIAIDEIYLIKSECEARRGNIDAAMEDLNLLLQSRYKTGTFVPYHVNNIQDALNLILVERRKELVFRTLRFTDIKRLNRNGANITLKRIINGETYTLPPNDSRYALPIPDNVIRLSGIQQN